MLPTFTVAPRNPPAPRSAGSPLAWKDEGQKAQAAVRSGVRQRPCRYLPTITFQIRVAAWQVPLEERLGLPDRSRSEMSQRCLDARVLVWRLRVAVRPLTTHATGPQSDSASRRRSSSRNSPYFRSSNPRSPRKYASA